MTDPDCMIVDRNFQNYAEDTVVDPGPNGWSIDKTQTPNALFFGVKSGKILAENLGGIGIWKSNEIPEVFVAERKGGFGTNIFRSSRLNGNKVQIIARIYNYDNADSATSKHYINRYWITTEDETCSSPPPPPAPLTVTASASNNGELGCANKVQLLANASTNNVTFNWSGPSFTSSLQNPEVTNPGTYTVTVTDTSGRTASDDITVTSSSSGTNGNIWVENFDHPNGTRSDTGSTAWSLQGGGQGTFSIQENVLKVAFNEANEGIWLSEIIDISSHQGVKIIAKLQSDTEKQNEDFFEDDDVIKVGYKINQGSEQIFYEDNAGLHGTTTGLENADAISSSLQGNTLQVIVRFKNSHPTEQYFLKEVTVKSESSSTTAVQATADVQGSLTCSQNEVSIIGGSSTTDVTYQWSGPNNFSATTKDILASNPGNYTFTVTTPSGCSDAVTVALLENKTIPNINATVSGSLGCEAGSVMLQGSSTTPNVTYSWSGPNGFNNSSQNPEVNQPGVYTLTVIDPNTGCNNMKSVTVTSLDSTEQLLWDENFNDLANGTQADQGTTAWTSRNTGNSGNVEVSNNSFKIRNTGIHNKGIWTSENIDISGNQEIYLSIDVKSAGPLNNSGDIKDYIKFYYVLDGGARVLFDEKSGAINNGSTGFVNVSVGSLSGNILRIEIEGKTTQPEEYYMFDNVIVNGVKSTPIQVTARANGSLSCLTSEVILYGETSASNATYNWSGPNNFTATTKDVTVSTPGTYTLTVTANGGCSESTTVEVLEDTSSPDISAVADGILDCNSSSVIITGGSSTPNVTFAWVGPNNFSSTSQSITVDNPGGYTLTVTGQNGCTSTKTVTIEENTTLPNITAEADGILDCNTSSVNIAGNSTTPNVTYAWIGPSNFSSTSQNIEVDTPGNYILTVTGTSGCKSTKTVTVVEDRTLPNITAEVDGTLGCNTSSVIITGNSTTAGVTFAWVGPENFSSAAQNITVDNPGDYTLTVTGPSGCTNTKTVTVNENNTLPDITAEVNGTLDCNTASVNITGDSTTAGVTYAWAGPGNFSSASQNITVDNPGDYTLTVTGANGCT